MVGLRFVTIDSSGISLDRSPRSMSTTSELPMMPSILRTPAVLSVFEIIRAPGTTSGEGDLPTVWLSFQH
jgi:hypothetical protein